MSPVDRITWVDEFLFIDGNEPTGSVLQQLQDATAQWVVISRWGGYLYAFTIKELWQWDALREARETRVDWLTLPFQAVLDLHEEFQSTPSTSRDNVPAIDRSWRLDATAPSISRYIQVRDANPIAIGYPAAASQLRRAKPPAAPVQSAPPTAARFEVFAARPAPVFPPGFTLDDYAIRRLEVLEPAEGSALANIPSEITVLEDEGTTPVRYPSIESDKPLTPGAKITVTVDLTRTKSEHTQGGEIALGQQAKDWTALELTVILSCPSVVFDADGRDVVTVKRNAASTAADITGTVRRNATHGEVAPIVATFFFGTRFCGTAVRTYVISPAANAPGAPVDPGPTIGLVVPQPAAAAPDVTVRIFMDGPCRLSWLVETARFDGLPPKLRASVDLPHDVDTEVAELFRRFAELKPGEHVTRIQSFGDELWGRTPQMFRDTYWALWDHYRRPLTIQFITNEPNMPWELMRPTRADESEIHQPLALQHPVARWLEDYDGYMRNQVPPGSIFTIAPKYPSVSLQLPFAQAESQKLVTAFGAHTVAGTRTAVFALLETLPPETPVALLHFAGHGQFVRTATSESSIQLEDGPLTAGEVKRPEVRLGKACRTLVFFNACDVGASGKLFGEVGGWAAAFLSRQFGGFIAPLWSVEDDDAGVVSDELLTGIITQRQPIGEVLRALRAKHGKTSPTFYSYLYYGDVTASLAP